MKIVSNILPNITKDKFFSFLKWAAIYVTAALISVVLTHFIPGVGKKDIVSTIFLIVPRMMTLALFAIPCQLMKYRYSSTMGMAAFWFLWIGFTNKCLLMALIPVGMCIVAGVLLFILYDRKYPGAALDKPFFSKLTILMMFSVLVIFALEMIQCTSFMKPFVSMIGDPDIFACNLLCLTAIGSFVFWMPKRVSAAILYLIVWFGLAIGSAYKVSILFEPLIPNDIHNAKDGLPAAISFLGVVGTTLVAVGIVLVIVGVIIIIKMEKGQRFKKNAFWGSLAFSAVIFLGLYFCSGAPGIRFDHEMKTKEAFEKHGFIYSFVTYSVETVFPQESEYNKDMVAEIKDEIAAQRKEDGDQDASQIKNLIVFQLESFMDPTTIEGAVYERDPLPFLHSLQENYTSGSISVPCYGGTTVRSEFEFLTGMNLDIFGKHGDTGLNPYTKYLKNQSVDSLVWALKEQGYSTTAIHNYQGEFFYRNEVYKNMGFDTFIPYECMSGIQKREGIIWGNDSIFESQIQYVLDHSTAERNFIFNVTVQLHGNYPSISEEEYCMSISGIEDETLRGQVAYYVNEMESFDLALSKICQYFEQRGEPTYILFYADHLPKFAKDTAGFDESERYQVQYFTWNNMGIEKEATEPIELYHLSTQLCNTVGIKGGFMNRFHNIYGSSEAYGEMLDEIQTYKFFYEHLDTHAQVDFSNPNFTVGVIPLAIESIEQNLDKTYTIKGSGFTADTWICINGERIEDESVGVLQYVDEHTLIYNSLGVELFPTDVIHVEIVGEKYGAVLKKSEPYIWPNNPGDVLERSAA